MAVWEKEEQEGQVKDVDVIPQLFVPKCNAWRYSVALVPHYAPSKQESRRFQVYSCDVVGKGPLCKY